MVEALAIPVATETFADLIFHRRAIWLIDSESALGGIVKGYSDREDISKAVTVFWDLVRKYNIDVYHDRTPADGSARPLGIG